MNNSNRKISGVVIGFIVVAFLILVGGGITTISGVLMKENRLIYLGLVLLGIGFILYIILFFVIVIKFVKKSGD